MSEIKEFEFKKLNKMPSCSSPPWAAFIEPLKRPEILRIIRQECLDEYSFSFDECEKRLTCLKKTCLGRKLPWKSKTALPYLKELIKHVPTQINKDSNELEMIVETNCNVCPIFKTCKNPCNQVLDFIERDKAPEPIIDYKETTDNLEFEIEIFEPANLFVNGSNIPWDVLSIKKAEVIRKYLFEQRDFRSIAETLNLNNQARVKYEMYSAINKLSEYATVRNFLDTKENLLTPRQKEIFNLVYRQNLTFVKVAEKLGISKQSVQQTVSRILKKYKVKWKTYVKKRGNKILYQVPEIFK